MDSDGEEARETSAAQKKTCDFDENSRNKNRSVVGEEQNPKTQENEKDSGLEETKTGTSEYVGCIKTTVHSTPPALNALTVDTNEAAASTSSESSSTKSPTKRESDDDRSESSKSTGGRTTARQAPTKFKTEEEMVSMEKRKPQEASPAQVGYASKSPPKVQQSSAKKESKVVRRSLVSDRTSVVSKRSKKAVVRRRGPARQTDDKTDKSEDDAFLRPSREVHVRDSACGKCGCTCFSPTTPKPCKFCGCYCRMLNNSLSKERIAK